LIHSETTPQVRQSLESNVGQTCVSAPPYVTHAPVDHPKMENRMPYILQGSEIVFDGKVFRVRIDSIQAPSGRTMRVDLVEHSGAVALIPIDSEGKIVFVRQYRHPASEVLLELPAGTLEPDEDPQTCAVRESREEIGMSPGTLTYLGGTYLAPGYSTEFIQYYLAQELTYDPLTPDTDEDLQIERITWQEIQEMIARQEIRDAKTLVGLYLARQHLAR
jgi:ADP-ribose pyrophosphatase